MEVRPAGASAVIVQRVQPADAEWFLEWQRGVAAAAEAHAGYRATEVYPADGQHDPWVIVMHFSDANALQAWLQSPTRAQWLDKLRDKSSDFQVKAMPVGFGAWFAETARQVGGPPGWKIVISVVLALFPTVILLAVFPGPYLAKIGFALSMLIGNFLSVSILQWVVSPPLNKVLQPWLAANSEKDRAYSIGGTVVILLVMAGLVVLFNLLGIGS